VSRSERQLMRQWNRALLQQFCRNASPIHDTRYVYVLSQLHTHTLHIA